MKNYILAIDQGTTSTRAIVFDAKGLSVGHDQVALQQYFPDDGWVEHDAEEIWQATLSTCRGALSNSHIDATQIAGIGISNQRETTIIWDRKTGKPMHKAIVWQDRRTADACQQFIADGLEPMVRAKTGLLLDPYFSATKIAWLLDNIHGARVKAEAGELAFGTVDSFLIWRLTAGKSHFTDATNASRTLLFNIHTQQWDAELLETFNIPIALLPEVKDCSDDFGLTQPSHFDAPIPIYGVAGDQQAATFGQSCFKPGMVKSTYGTGCFILMNTGAQVVDSANRLLSTVAYRLGGKVTYGLEGSIFVAGAAVQWLRDTVRLISDHSEAERLAMTVPDNGGVYLVPAFTGLGAPYWDPLARGAILGLTRDSGVAHIVRAALEAVCYQTKDLMDAMVADGASKPATLRVDGGMVTNDWLVQFLADILDVAVERTQLHEISALGVAYLAGLRAGVFASLTDIENLWQRQGCFAAKMDAQTRAHLYAGWCEAVQRITTVEQ